LFVFTVLRHLNFQKPTSQQGKITNMGKNKTHADILKLSFYNKMSHINGKGQESAIGFATHAQS
jgi:hypothetical protein